MHLIGRISVLRQKIRFEKESIESSLKTELEIYNELFSLMERMNPFDEASSSWKLVHINPKQQKLAQLEELFVSAGQLLDTAKTKAHILGDPSKCRSKNCTAFVTGQFKLCGDGNCEAYLTGDVDKCISRDCKAYVKNDIKKCYTNDCRAYLSGDPDQCTSHDCKAYLTGNSKECMSGDCVAYLRQNPKECHSCDCKAYLSFRGVGELLRIRTHIAGYEPHSIPLGVVFSNHLEDDQEEIPSIGRSPRNCSPVFEYSGKQ